MSTDEGATPALYRVRHLLSRSPVTAASTHVSRSEKMSLKTLSRPLFPTLLLLALSGLSLAQVSVNISVGVPPPELPVYEQPPIPGDGYVWTPGYWAWSDDDQDYYWVPGTWVLAPQPEYLWTPGYWGWGGAAFIWHTGYWGPHVGFYGGGNYCLGYGGARRQSGHLAGGRGDHQPPLDNYPKNTNTQHLHNTPINNDPPNTNSSPLTPTH